MKQIVKVLCIGCVYLLCFPLISLAEESNAETNSVTDASSTTVETETPGSEQDTVEYQHRGLTLTFFVPLSTAMRLENPSTNFHLNALVGKLSKVEGLELGGVLNIVEHTMRGIEIAGFGNIVKQEMDGIQVGGIFNVAKGMLHGIQFGVVNISNAGDRALQLGVMNISKTHHIGWQVGVINKAKKITGWQVGIVNIAEEIEYGFPIGIINIVKNVPVRVIGWLTNNAQPNLRMNLGVKYSPSHFYTLVAAEFDTRFADTDDWDSVWSSGFTFGLGFNFPISKLFFAAEASYHLMYDLDNQWTDKVSGSRKWLNDLQGYLVPRIQIGFQIAEKFALTGGLGLRMIMYRAKLDETTRQPVKPFSKVYPELSVGIELM